MAEPARIGLLVTCLVDLFRLSVEFTKVELPWIARSQEIGHTIMPSRRRPGPIYALHVRLIHGSRPSPG